jgi:tetratricopeptide (TPR) repeat protein
MKNRTQYILIAFIGILLYANTIGNRYSLDDDFVIYKKAYNEQSFINSISEIFKSHYSVTDKSKYEYRPIVKITFAIEFFLWGNNPHLSHCVNLVIFILTLFILFKILHRLFYEKYPWLPLLITMVFAAHPIHTEVVASLKNRDELLAFMFSLLTIWVILLHCDTKKWYYLVLSLPIYLIAYLSKSSALVFVAIIPLILWFAGIKNYKYYLIVFLLIAAGAFLARYVPQYFLENSHRAVYGFENPIYENRGLFNRIGTGLVALLFYLRLLIIPYPLRFYYGFDTIPLTHFPDFISVLSLILHAALLIYAITKFKSRHPLSFAILFYLIAISMFSNIVRPAVGIVAERYVYAASLGFCVALVWFILKLFKYENRPLTSLVNFNKGIRITMLALIFVYGARTISRNSVWKDHLTLFYNDIPRCQNSFKANFLLATTLQVEVSKTMNNAKYAKRNAKYIEDAEKYYNRALEIYDRYPVAWNSRGFFLFMFKQNTSQAISDFKNATELKPDYTEALYNLGFVYNHQKEYDSALVYLDKAIISNKDYLNSYNEKGVVLLNLKDTAGFLQMQEAMKNQFPESDFPYINLGNYFLGQKDTSEAFNNWEQAAKRNPDNQPLLLNLSNYYSRKGDMEKSQYYNKLYRQAVQKQKNK